VKRLRDIPLGLIGLAAAVGFSGVFVVMSPGTAASLRSFFGPIAGCDIKGNISFVSGERIYHTRGQYHYDETIISFERGERWFCSEGEAVMAGWRHSGI
jgi:hypothetical protein